MNAYDAPPPPPLDDEDNNTVTKVARSAAEQGSAIPTGWKQTPNAPLPVIRCTATKSDGTQCKKWSVRGVTVCIKHGAQLPQVKKAAAARVEATRLRMWGATPEAFEVLEALMQPGVAEGIRLKAATEMLDRAGLKAGQEVNVTVEHVGSPMDDILTQLQIIGGHVDPNKDLEVLDAEEIEEES